VSFCAGPTAIGRIRAGRGAPFLAAITEPSIHARLQSIRSAFSQSAQQFAVKAIPHTTVLPVARPSPARHPQAAAHLGRQLSQGIPLRSTNRMPISAARSATGGRPPFGLGAAGGSSGATIDHKESGIRGEGIPPHESSIPRRTRVLKGALNWLIASRMGTRTLRLPTNCAGQRHATNPAPHHFTRGRTDDGRRCKKSEISQRPGLPLCGHWIVTHQGIKSVGEENGEFSS
jgi:hypothetical protein